LSNTLGAPDSNTKYPIHNYTQLCYIKNTVQSDNIIAGDYSYYHNISGKSEFEDTVLYNFQAVQSKIIIGKFCSIAHGVRFMTDGGAHNLFGISTYPFHLFGHGWQGTEPDPSNMPYKGDTVIGNDVWIGYDSIIMPGVKVGNGAVIAARSVVTRDVPAYSIVAGNPASLIRQRFDSDVVAKLESLAWWDLPIDDITRCIPYLIARDIDALEREISRETK
jgi:virginiamycin A acetyltransferase